MSTILIGVDASERSEDAIAFGRRLADAAGATRRRRQRLPLLRRPAAAPPTRPTARRCATTRSRPSRATCATALEGIPDERAQIRIMANPSPAHALHDLAEAERAALVDRRLDAHRPRRPRAARQHRRAPAARRAVLGRGRPQGLPHARRTSRSAGSASPTTAPTRRRPPCTPPPSWRARFGAELEVIGVVSTESYATPALMGGPSVGHAARGHRAPRPGEPRRDRRRASRPTSRPRSVRLTGDPAELLADAQREARPARHRLARLRPAARRARRRRQRPR